MPICITRALFARAFLTLLLTAPLYAGSDTAALFSAAEFSENVKFLASDELKGRGVGSPGIDQAADFIADKLKAAGCRPAGVDGTWFQPFDIVRGKKIDEERAELKFSGVEHSTRLREDWIPLPFSALENAEGELVFAGYGIEAPEHDWNDYADLDVKGKVVLVLRYEPRSEDQKARFGGKTASRYAQFRTKAEIAAKKGAKALLVVNAPLREPADEPLYKFNERMANETYDLPMAHISPALAEALLAKAKLPNLETLQKELDTSRKPLSKAMNIAVSLKPALEKRILKARNVIARLDGDGSTDELIVVGAHYDHLGVAPRSFQSRDDTPLIHNGADDNASGTAGIIALAQAFASHPKTRRGFVFIAFSGEEMGLLGSKHFVANPTVPLDRVKAMINFDMIGRYDLDRLTVFGSSSAEEWHDMVTRAVDKVGLRCNVPLGRGSYDSRSDHFPFFQKKIPILFTFTGMHPEYHQPEDDWELVDCEGATKVLQLNYLVLREAANLTRGPTFVDYLSDREDAPTTRPAGDAHAAADPSAPGSDAKPPPMPRVRLGIVPDYTESEQPGLVIDSVADEGAAKEAGMQKGDRIVRIGEKKIIDIGGYMAALRDFSPGDEVEIEVERAGKRVVMKVTLRGAPGRGRE